MYKLESDSENETQKIHWNFETKTDHQIPAKRPELELINKKSCRSWILSFPADRGVKIEKKYTWNSLRNNNNNKKE